MGRGECWEEPQPYAVIVSFPSRQEPVLRWTEGENSLQGEGMRREGMALITSHLELALSTTSNGYYDLLPEAL